MTDEQRKTAEQNGKITENKRKADNAKEVSKCR